MLIGAFERFLNTLKKKNGQEPNIKLVLVGKRDFFYRKLIIQTQMLLGKNNIVFWGHATDNELAQLYTHAKVLIMPSLMEGFGLPPLESLTCGTPVLVSDIPAFREILGEWAMYFNPTNEQDLVDKLIYIWENHTKVKKSLPQPTEVYNTYFWEKTAFETLRSYGYTQ